MLPLTKPCISQDLVSNSPKNNELRTSMSLLIRRKRCSLLNLPAIQLTKKSKSLNRKEREEIRHFNSVDRNLMKTIVILCSSFKMITPCVNRKSKNKDNRKSKSRRRKMSLRNWMPKSSKRSLRLRRIKIPSMSKKYTKSLYCLSNPNSKRSLKRDQSLSVLN